MVATIHCPNCGYESPLFGQFCSKCGQPLTAKCRVCGEDNLSDAKFCRNCGAELAPATFGLFLDRAMKVGSPEYPAEVQRRTNSDAEYLQMAKNENESYTMIMEADPKHGVLSSVIIGYQAKEGKIVDIWSGKRLTTFMIFGPYGVWVDILRGKLGPRKAFFMHNLKVRGNFLKTLSKSRNDSVIRWLKILQSIPTAFEGDYAQFNITG